MPSFGRQTMSFLVLAGDSAIVLDAGTGLGRLLEPGIRAQVERYDRLNIVLSHYHLDHVVGLSYLPGVWGNRPARIFAPAPPFVDAHPDDALRHLLNPPLFQSWRDFPGPVEIVPILQSSFDIDGIPVQVRRQKHSGGSIGIRVGDVMVYMTDTTIEKDPPLPFLTGARLLIHEAWFTAPVDADIAEKAGHSRLTDVLELAAASGIPGLMPVHFHPGLESAVQAIAQTAIPSGVEVIIPAEGVTYDI
jgi:ribonuclease BN (tRNA processing enzyme)